MKPQVFNNYRVQSIDSKTQGDRIATAAYNTGSSLFIILSSQTSSRLYEILFACVPTLKTGRRVPGRRTIANFEKAEVFNMRGCINHVGSPKRRLQAVAEVLPKPRPKLFSHSSMITSGRAELHHSAQDEQEVTAMYVFSKNTLATPVRMRASL